MILVLANTKCSRCGTSKKIEKHRIVHGAAGGKYVPSNIRLLCRACHDYIHTFEKIEKSIIKARRKKIKWIRNTSRYKYWKGRLKILINRLERLEKLNTIGNILKYGYRTYWI